MRTRTLNKFSTIIIVIALVLVNSIALGQDNTVSINDAINVANSFKPKSRSMSRSGQPEKKPELAYTCADDTSNKPFYYVFNYADDKGFVIISSDKRAKQVIGYSYNGRFDMNNIPDQLKDLLNIYEQELSDLSITPDSLLKLDLNETFKGRGVSLPVSVAPILGDIKYNQYSPYNDMCPMHNGKRSVTGCVATATAQIMGFYKHPAKGKGSNDYTTQNGIHSNVNFANATYNWDNILPSYYNNMGTSVQNNEIAKLLFHIGVSCNMNYTSTGSAASLRDVSNALVNNFSYDANLQRYSRDYFTQKEWKDLLKTELAAGRPVLFEGYDAENGGGHCFVCDGYDATGLYHINWGWGGMADGYFSLDNLNPSLMGAGSGSGSYNNNVAFIGGIQPSKDGTKHFNNISVDNISTPSQIQRTASFKFTISRLQNSGLSMFNGSVGLALYKNGTFQQTICENSLSLRDGSSYSSYNFNVSFPGSVANGVYDLVVVSKSEGQDNWELCLSKNSTNNCVTVNISSQNIRFEKNTDKTYTDFAKLPIQAPEQEEESYNTFDDYENNNNTTGGNNGSNNNIVAPPTPPTPNTPAKPCLANTINFTGDINKLDPNNFRFSCDITNSGSTTFNNKLGAFLYNREGNKCIGEIDVKNYTIEGGKTLQATFNNKLTIADGSYIITLLYMDNNGKYVQLEPNSNTVKFVSFAKPATNIVTPPTVNTNYTTKINPVILNPIKFTNGSANSIDASKIQFSCNIQNQSQTNYKNYISAHLYSVDSKYIGEIGTQICNLASDEKIELKFSKSIEATPGKYFIALFFINESDKYTPLQPRSYAMQSIQIVDPSNCEGDNCVAPNTQEENKYESEKNTKIQTKTQIQTKTNSTKVNNQIVSKETAKTDTKIAKKTDFLFESISVKGNVTGKKNGTIMEYETRKNSWLTISGVFKNTNRRGSVNIGLCVVKYQGDYVTDIKEIKANTLPGLKHTVIGHYQVKLDPGKYIITGFVSEDGEYKPIGDENDNYVILNVK